MNGHCYRLYSSAVFNDEFSSDLPPEIRHRPLEDIVLYLKVLGIRVSVFPFPTKPERSVVSASLRKLVSLGALKFRNPRKEPDFIDDGK